ncbi:MAG: LacI family DNA-binding transcriptional regulator [Eubacteriales bacterium]|nr:LacI family DNA-binding transcriptional regulator [Eubacteriales bacterium]
MEQITIKEIAQLCGVGVSTVSRAINNHPDINEETRKKIMDTIQKYNYIPNNSARNLKRAASKTIAVLVKGISNPFFGAVIDVIEREIIHNRYTFYLQQVEEHEDEVEVAIQLEKEKRLKGIVFLGGMHQHPADRLKMLTVPSVIVTVDMKLPEDIENCGAVSIDDEAESYRMVDYLCHQGYQHIAIATPEQSDESVGSARLEGYKRALLANGREVDESLILFIRRDANTYSMRKGYETAKQLLESGSKFDCLYCVADTIAVGACRAVIDAGLRIPEDVAVAGFDGTDMARYYHPSITTVCQPREEMASRAAAMLFDMIRKRKVKEHKVLFEAQLQVGESTH